MISMQEIGHVNSGFKEPEELKVACREGRLFSAESEIVLTCGHPEMLKGLEHFSHAWILYHLHRAGRVEPVTHPGPAGMKLPKAGVLASRSQYRPNHIALRLVQIVKVKEGSVKVKGLDAIDGSPVLDIKPYVTHFDLPENPKVAEWYEGWSGGGNG